MEKTVSPSPLPQPRTSKLERLRRMAGRYPSLGIDLAALEAYKAVIALASELWAGSGSHLARFGLGDGRFTVLALLLDSLPEPLSHSELADLSCVTKGSITGLVDGLVQDGLVKREDSGEDRRVRLIALTPAGREVIDQALPEHFRKIAGLMGGLAPKELKTLAALLTKIQEGLPASQSE